MLLALSQQHHMSTPQLSPQPWCPPLGACDSVLLCASSLILSQTGRGTCADESVGFGCFQKCLSWQMVPAGDSSTVECVVSFKWGHKSDSAMRRVPCRVVSASMSQSSRLKEPPAHTRKIHPQLNSDLSVCRRQLCLVRGRVCCWLLPAEPRAELNLSGPPASQLPSQIST